MKKQQKPGKRQKPAHVDYDTLDRAKAAFIAAGEKTRTFAKKFGFIPESGFGASANIFNLDLKKFQSAKNSQLALTLLPEGLGTSDDARPPDLTKKEQEEFWHNIGIKTVAVMTNDAAAAGIQTVLISLYLPSSTPEKVFNPEFMKGFLKGFVKGCKEVGCVYFSGETPQLKGKIVPGKLDIAGALFGIVPPNQKPINSSQLDANNTIVFLQSSGPHDNGFTALRQLAEKLPEGYRTKLPNGQEYWRAINKPTILYTSVIQSILQAGIQPTNIEPITGHGWQKLMRSKKPLRYVIENMLPIPKIFQFVQKHLNMTSEEMIKIFNYGAGLAIFTKTKKDAEKIIEIAKRHRIKGIIAGHTEKSAKREVEIRPLKIRLVGNDFLLSK